MMKDHIIGPLFFQKATVTSHLYLDVEEHYTVPQLHCDAWFQQDGEPHILETMSIGFQTNAFQTSGLEEAVS
jgi:hypothetical protein